MKKYPQLTVIFLFALHSFSFSQGSGYCGPYTISSPIVWNGKHDALISGLEITNPTGYCIYLINCDNITIQNCKLGPAKDVGVILNTCTNIHITNCSMDSIESGVYALQSQGVEITYNDVKNVHGPFPRGQMVQFDKVYGTGNRINYNVGENILGQSYPEDEISVYMSNGTAEDPIQVIGNWIRGGGPSGSGGGIMCGDNGSSYLLVQDNILVNPGQYGIAIASGTNITINNNKIYAKRQPFTNVGLYVWNQYPSACNTITVSNNQINWTGGKGTSNGCWNNGNCGIVSGWNTNNCSANIDSTILPAKIIGRCLSASADIIKPLSEYFYIYPNPVFESVTIETSPVIKESTLSIYNVNGLKLIEHSIKESKAELNLSSLASGMYIIKLTNNQTIEVRKIIKE
jgi:hypothetical protein